MSGQTLRVIAPSRLHFGLLAFGTGCDRRYGGVGVMVEHPGLDLRISPSQSFAVTGPLSRRVCALVRRWSDWHQQPHAPNCRIDVRSAPALHVGLGVGTQLALAIASGLNRFVLAKHAVSVSELAESTGRGLRSAVGTLGFELGGLISERGKVGQQTLSPLDCRIGLPAEWRFVLLRPAGVGLHGRGEEGAFSALAPIPPEVSQRLTAELQESLLPAARLGQFNEFSESVYRYGHTSGQCFAEIQGGAYNGAEATRLVSRIQAAGTRGVGQSSWGPTIFAVAADQAAAESLVEQLRDEPAAADAVITPPNNLGARFQWE